MTPAVDGQLSDLRGRIFAEFEPVDARSIAEFHKHLAEIDADALMFMARKSYCVYDMFTKLGVAGSPLPILSDRVLDLNVDPLKTRRVALVDDTVILGSTLARAKRTLESSDVGTTVHALAVNKDSYVPELVTIDYAQVFMSDEAVKTLCASEVRALSLLPRPYMVDFPLYEGLRVQTSDLHAFLSSIEWTVHSLTAPHQAVTDSVTYTFFPSEELREELRQRLGVAVFNCLDIIKLRAFGRFLDGTLQLTIVPLITLRPLKTADLHSLTRHLLESIALRSTPATDELIQALQSPQAFVRMIQYLLGAGLVERFLWSTRGAVQTSRDSHLSALDVDAHFGPWNSLNIGAALTSARTAFAKDGRLFTARAHLNMPKLEPVATPPSLQLWSQTLLEDRDTETSDSIQLSLEAENPSSGRVETDMAEVFLAMFHRYELPARREAATAGADYLDETGSGPSRADRLLQGITWPTLANYLCLKYRLPQTRDFRDLLSLSLDRLNDMGVAVPIIREIDGIVVRAYRHGEDVTWQDAECDLAHEMVRGLLSASGWDTVPRLVLEKALVILIRVGVSSGFLTYRPEATAAPPVARVSYDLLGAVTRIRTQARSVVGNEHWLTSYLPRRGVLVRKDKEYALGEKLGASQVNHNALSSAFSVGYLLGSLVRGDTERPALQGEARATNRTRGLTDDDLVALTTCTDPRTMLAALQAELGAFTEWWRGPGRRRLEGLDWNNAARVQETVKHLDRANGRTAVTSASRKMRDWSGMRWRTVVSQSRDRLARRSQRDASDWNAFWWPLMETEEHAREQEIRRALIFSAELCWRAFACLSLLDACLTRASGLDDASATRKLTSISEKLERFAARMSAAAVSHPGLVGKYEDIIAGWARRSPVPDAAQTFAKAAIDTTDQLVDEMQIHASECERLLAQFGTIATAKQYEFLVWYDIYDSKGNHPHPPVRGHQYRQNVHAWREAVNDTLLQIQRSAAKQSCDIHVWNGDISSVNDEKYIAVSGSRALFWARETLRRVQDVSFRFPSVKYRAIFVPTDFVGTNLWRMGDASELRGGQFLEHLSVLRKFVRTVEAEYLPEQSVLLIGGQSLVDVVTSDANVGLVDPVRTSTRTEVAFRTCEVEVLYGGVPERLQESD